MTQTKNIEAGARTQETAVLNCRIRRNPRSLAGYHYHLEAGKKVYIVFRNESFAMVATMPQADCICDDYFRVPIGSLTISA